MGDGYDYKGKAVVVNKKDRDKSFQRGELERHRCGALGSDQTCIIPGV